MLAGLRKRLARKPLEIKECDDDDKDDLHAFTPPTNYIKISQGKIQLVHQSRSLESDTSDGQSKKEREVLENRIVELEEALLRLQEKVNNSQCGSPTFEKELREQLENMNRVMKSKERKQMQTFRDNKALQTRFARQENLLHAMQQENKALLLRIRQYEHCLDDVMRKVVDAIVAEDNLREEVAMLKSRVRDLEAQNAALSASPAKGRDEGYCTMSSGQPQPSNGHLEDLPEEPEQWLLPAEPCSTEMEDWSMSQEELAVISLDEERELSHHHLQQQQQQQHHHQHHQHQHGRLQMKQNGEHDWIWNSNDFLNSTMVETDSVSDGISQLLQQKIVYSEDEEIACTEFTNDFYKLVNIRSNSARSLYSYIEGETDDEDDDDDSSLSESNIRLRSQNSTTTRRLQRPSPTPSEAGRAQVTSCSSSESDELSRCTTTTTTTQQEHHEHLETNEEPCMMVEQESALQMNSQHSDIEIEDVQLDSEPHKIVTPLDEKQCIEEIINTELRRPMPHLLVKSKSTIDEDEPSCILRNNQRREIESNVVRSGSVNCAIAANVERESITNTNSNANVMKLQERALQKPANSWRKSNGWKRVKSPVQSPTALISPKKEIKSEITKSFQPVQKILPTRIPTSIATPSIQQQTHTTTAILQQLQQPAQSATRKSKIPPPVPVRRS